MHPSVQAETQQCTTPSCEQWRIELNGLSSTIAVHHALRILVARLQAMNQLLGRLPSRNAVQCKFWEHPLVPVTPLQHGNSVREHLLGSHSDEPLADALVVLTHRRRGHCASVCLLPRGLRAILALHTVLGCAGKVEYAQRLQLQQLAKLKQGRARSRHVRGIEQDGVSRLELGSVVFQENIGTHNRGRQANLLRSQLLEDCRADPQDVVLVADQQGPRRADWPLARKLGRLGQHEHAVLLLEVLDVGTDLLDAADTGHSQAYAALRQLRIDHGIVKRHRQHADKHLVVVDGLLNGPRLGLHLHWPSHLLAIGVRLWRPQDVLHRTGVVHLGGHLGSIEQGILHEILVGHDHLRLITLTHPLRKAILVLRRPFVHAVLDVHHSLSIQLLRPLMPGHTTASEAHGKLLLCRALCATCGIVEGTLVLVGEDVVGFVQQLERLWIATLIRVLSKHLLSELGADLLEFRIFLHTDELVVVRLSHRGSLGKSVAHPSLLF
mmetsp:Transcript_14444/g.46623  ORF Transcript_14444/g.46623 Transcript_14444/m.46623 type:complete len:495 (-) Transcript_14444:21-1505(-)